MSLLWAGAFANVGAIATYYVLDGADRVLMMACYLPLLLWGPLLGAVTVSYARRHGTGAAASGAGSPST